MSSYDRALWTLRSGLDSWTGMAPSLWGCTGRATIFSLLSTMTADGERRSTQRAWSTCPTAAPSPTGDRRACRRARKNRSWRKVRSVTTCGRFRFYDLCQPGQLSEDLPALHAQASASWGRQGLEEATHAVWRRRLRQQSLDRSRTKVRDRGRRDGRARCRAVPGRCPRAPRVRSPARNRGPRAPAPGGCSARPAARSFRPD
jgi:hypothetical protein